jgi:hypothetical protein
MSRSGCVVVVVMVGVLLTAVGASVTGSFGTIPYVRVKGTYYDAGVQTGAAMARIIANRSSCHDMTDIMAWALSSKEGQAVNTTLYHNAMDAYPHYIDELRGVAAGSGQSFATIFLLSTLDEMYHVHSPWRRVEHCSDVITNSHTPAWGHNEDSGEYDLHNTYMVIAEIVDSQGYLLENFTAYTYAGSLAGKAFGWNAYGLQLSNNALFALNLNYEGVPRYYANRAQYAAKSPEEIMGILHNRVSTTGFTVNYGSVVGPLRLHSSEVDPMGAVSVRPIPSIDHNKSPIDGQPAPSSHYYHTNIYLELTTKCELGNSSIARLNRMAEFPSPRTAHDVVQMIGDTKNASYPIYRQGQGQVWTLASVVFDLVAKTALLFDANPKLTHPVAVLKLF